MLPNDRRIVMAAVLTDMICPICGASSRKKTFVRFLCQDCWAAQQKLKLPEKIVIERCKRCRKTRVKKAWLEGQKELKEEIAGMCRWKGERICIGVKELDDSHCKIVLRIGDVQIEKDIPVEWHTTLCQDCTKLVRGYYEAIIQLRTESREVTPELEKLKDSIVRELENITFMPKIDKHKFGFDIYVGSTSAAFNILRAAGLRYTSTRKLFTQKAGKNLYRTTFLVKL